MTAVLVICCVLILLTAVVLLIYGIYALLICFCSHIKRLPDKFRNIIVYHESHNVTEYGIISAIAKELNATLRSKCECDLDDLDYKSYHFSVVDGHLMIRHSEPPRKLSKGHYKFCLESTAIRFDLADPEIIEKIREWYNHRVFCHKHGISEK